MNNHTSTLKVTKVEKLNITDVVYNFSVEEDESYVADGIVMHNCRCRLAPAKDNIPDVPDAGEAEFDEWLNS